MRALWAITLIAGLLPAAPAAAQPRRLAVLFAPSPDAPTARREAFRVHVERAARVAGYAVVEDPVAWARERSDSAGTVMPARIQPFREVEALLVEARQAAAALREGEALARLARAERLVRAHADVPGAAAWLAEVETTIGITAAQAGIAALVEAALSRAATLDPTRGVRAAEAPPPVVERAEAIARAVATRPTGTFEVRTAAEGARVFLDDEELGLAPRIVRAPVGTHVLRVEAPGFLPWGRVVEVHEGRRPAVAVRLAPDPWVTAARRLERASDPPEPAALPEALAALGGLDAAWVVRVGEGPEDRALLVPCVAEGCAEPRRLEVDAVPIVVGAVEPLPAERVEGALASAGAWLLRPAPAPPPPPPPAPWWQRWYTWAGAAVLVGAAVGTGLWLARPDPERQRRIVIDPGELSDP